MKTEKSNAGLICGAIGLIIGLIVGVVFGVTISTGIYSRGTDKMVGEMQSEIAALQDEVDSYRLTFDALGIGPRLKEKK